MTSPKLSNHQPRQSTASAERSLLGDMTTTLRDTKALLTCIAVGNMRRGSNYTLGNAFYR